VRAGRQPISDVVTAGRLRVADAIARRDDEGHFEQWKESLDDTGHRRLFGMRCNVVIRGPTVDDVEDIGCVRLLIQVVVEASGLRPCGSNEFEQKSLDLRAIERLAAYLADDVALLELFVRHV
jgi:hypothetical protein